MPRKESEWNAFQRANKGKWSAAQLSEQWRLYKASLVNKLGQGGPLPAQQSQETRQGVFGNAAHTKQHINSQQTRQSHTSSAFLAEPGVECPAVPHNCLPFAATVADQQNIICATQSLDGSHALNKPSMGQQSSARPNHWQNPAAGSAGLQQQQQKQHTQQAAAKRLSWTEFQLANKSQGWSKQMFSQEWQQYKTSGSAAGTACAPPDTTAEACAADCTSQAQDWDMADRPAAQSSQSTVGIEQQKQNLSSLQTMQLASKPSTSIMQTLQSVNPAAGSLTWNQFQKAHSGRGWSKQEMSAAYKQYKQSAQHTGGTVGGGAPPSDQNQTAVKSSIPAAMRAWLNCKSHDVGHVANAALAKHDGSSTSGGPSAATALHGAQHSADGATVAACVDPSNTQADQVCCPAIPAAPPPTASVAHPSNLHHAAQATLPKVPLRRSSRIADLWHKLRPGTTTTLQAAGKLCNSTSAAPGCSTVHSAGMCTSSMHGAGSSHEAYIHKQHKAKGIHRYWPLRLRKSSAQARKRFMKQNDSRTVSSSRDSSDVATGSRNMVGTPFVSPVRSSSGRPGQRTTRRTPIKLHSSYTPVKTAAPTTHRTPIRNPTPHRTAARASPGTPHSPFLVRRPAINTPPTRHPSRGIAISSRRSLRLAASPARTPVPGSMENTPFHRPTHLTPSRMTMAGRVGNLSPTPGRQEVYMVDESSDCSSSAQGRQSGTAEEMQCNSTTQDDQSRSQDVSDGIITLVDAMHGTSHDVHPGTQQPLTAVAGSDCATRVVLSPLPTSNGAANEMLLSAAREGYTPDQQGYGTIASCSVQLPFQSPSYTRPVGGKENIHDSQMQACNKAVLTAGVCSSTASMTESHHAVFGPQVSVSSTSDAVSSQCTMMMRSPPTSMQTAPCSAGVPATAAAACAVTPWHPRISTIGGRRVREYIHDYEPSLFSGFTAWVAVHHARLKAIKRDIPNRPGLYEWGAVLPGSSQVVAFYLGKAGVECSQM